VHTEWHIVVAAVHLLTRGPHTNVTGMGGVCALLAAALVFFFSSRRRHTRSLRDWSSDVCSSDLHQGVKPEWICHNRQEVIDMVEIGRASCRERVEISGVAVSEKKKKDILPRPGRYLVRIK